MSSTSSSTLSGFSFSPSLQRLSEISTVINFGDHVSNVHTPISGSTSDGISDDQYGMRVITTLTLENNRLLPNVDLILRQHGSSVIAQREFGEPLTTFIYVAGSQSPEDYDYGGRFHHTVMATKPVEFYILPRSLLPQTQGLVEVVLRFNDVRDADHAIAELRSIGNPCLTPPRLDLKVYAIAAVQYCNLLRRISNISGEEVTTLDTMSPTFHRGHDGQILIQACHQDLVGDNLAGAPNQAYVTFAGTSAYELAAHFGSVKGMLTVGGADPRRPIMMFVVEFHIPGIVDMVVEFFRDQAAQGVNHHDLIMWAMPYNPAVFDAPVVVRSLEEDNAHHPVVAFQRRWSGEHAVNDSSSEVGSFNSQRASFNSQRGSMSPAQGSSGGLRSSRHREKNNVNMYTIVQGIDIRTTVMFRNIPADMRTQSFEAFVQAMAPGRYDFIYVRKDFSNGKNVGYAFVNLLSPNDIMPFIEDAVGHRWPNSHKFVDMSYATVQGRDALIEKFRNSVIMTEDDSARPHLYYAQGHSLCGRREDFPGPNNQMKVYRSTQNLDTIGLFNGRKDRSRRGRYDPGNPRGEMEHVLQENRALRMQLDNARMFQRR